MLKLVRTLAIICAAVTAAQTASAQSTYPDNPIHFIVAFVPGGATDTFARQISNDLVRRLASRSSSNRPAPAAPCVEPCRLLRSDGYTSRRRRTHAIASVSCKKSKSNFDPITVRRGGRSCRVAVAGGRQQRAGQVGERALAYSKTVPQKMNFASAGVGASHPTSRFGDKTGMQGARPGRRPGGSATPGRRPRR